MSSRQGRTLIVILVCSIAVNLLLIGGIAGRIMSGFEGGRPFPSHLRWILSDLDKETRKRLGPILRGHAENARPARREMAEAQKEFENALTNDPMNEKEVRSAMEKLQRLSVTHQTNLHRQMLGIMKELNHEQRVKALRFLHHKERGRKRLQRDRPPHRPIDP